MNFFSTPHYFGVNFTCLMNPVDKFAFLGGALRIDMYFSSSTGIEEFSCCDTKTYSQCVSFS